MSKDRRLLALYLFYGVNFMATGMTTFAAKFYGEIGLSDGRIGLIAAVLALVALFAQPAWGMLADRARDMRRVLAAALALAGLMCFLVLPASSRFIPLLIVLTLYNAFTLPAMPVGNAIAIEYTDAHGRSFGPVRMMGTLGYQAAILITGFVLARSLRGLYPAMGAVLLAAAGAALLLPKVQAAAPARRRADIRVFFRDKTLLLLFAVAFLANIGHQFNLTFFSKHLGDLGMSNTVTGFITAFSLLLEIPFLLIADKLMKRLSIWTWMTIGLVLGAVRYALLSVVRAPALIVLAQMLSIAQLSCFEFFPQIHLGRVTRKDLLASVQSVYTVITFGIARIAASLIGGAVADAAGIPFMYGLCAGIMAVTAAAFFIPMRRQARADSKQEQAVSN